MENVFCQTLFEAKNRLKPLSVSVYIFFGEKSKKIEEGKTNISFSDVILTHLKVAALKKKSQQMSFSVGNVLFAMVNIFENPYVISNFRTFSIFFLRRRHKNSKVLS